MWVQTNLYKHKWLQLTEDTGTWVYLEVHNVLAARGKEAYLHFTTFDVWDEADRLVRRIKATGDKFTPENRPGIWFPIVDTKPSVPKKWRVKPYRIFVMEAIEKLDRQANR